MAILIQMPTTTSSSTSCLRVDTGEAAGHVLPAPVKRYHMRLAAAALFRASAHADLRNHAPTHGLPVPLKRYTSTASTPLSMWYVLRTIDGATIDPDHVSSASAATSASIAGTLSL